MTTTPSNESPTAAEAAAPEHQQLLGQLNGDQDALANFLKELDQQDQQDRGAVGGVPRQPESVTPSRELARPAATRQSQQEEAQGQEAPPTQEELAQIYGDVITRAANEAGIDLWQWEQDVRSGRDTAAQRKALAAAVGIPEAAIERYEQGARPSPGSPPAAEQSQEEGGFTDLEVRGLVAIAGSEDDFASLAAWAGERLRGDPLLDDYNTAIKEGNALAARVALRTIVALSREDRGYEPRLLQGRGASAGGADAFRSPEEVLEAMSVDPKGGVPRYYRDPAYRRSVDEKVARSGELF